MEIIHRELKRGGDIADQIMMGKAQWKDLFVKHTFFTEGYKYYLSVISASTTREAQNIWSGLVESKVRLLVVGLEGHDSIALAHPFNKGFERVHECRTEEEIEKAKSGNLEFLVKEIISDTKDAGPTKTVPVDDAKMSENGSKTTIVYTTTHYIGLELREGKYPPI
jgi:poly(A) polymerase